MGDIRGIGKEGSLGFWERNSRNFGLKILHIRVTKSSQIITSIYILQSVLVKGVENKGLLKGLQQFVYLVGMQEECCGKMQGVPTPNEHGN